MTDKIAYSRHDDIVVLRIENPPVNALSQAVRQGLADGMDRAEAEEGVRAVMIVGEGRAFIAGADITEFGKPPMEPHLPSLCNRIEASPLLVVASMRRHYFIGALRKSKIPSVLSPYAVCSAAALSRISCGVLDTTSPLRGSNIPPSIRSTKLGPVRLIVFRTAR